MEKRRPKENCEQSGRNRGLIYKNVLQFRPGLRLKIMSHRVLLFDSQKMLSLKKMHARAGSENPI